MSEITKWSIINGEETSVFFDELDFEEEIIDLVKSNESLNLKMTCKDGQMTVECL